MAGGAQQVRWLALTIRVLRVVTAASTAVLWVCVLFWTVATGIALLAGEIMDAALYGSLAFWMAMALLAERKVRQFEANGCESRKPDRVELIPGGVARYWYRGAK